MKVTATISAVSAVLLSIGGASAIQSYTVSHEEDYLLTMGDTLTRTWDVTGAPFGFANVSAASASFAFFQPDKSGALSYVDIDLGNTGSPPGYWTFAGNYQATYDLASFGLDGLTLLADITDDGLLSYTIKAINTRRVVSDFVVDYARLTVTTSVPDGGFSIVLLGIGLLGFARLKRN